MSSNANFLLLYRSAVGQTIGAFHRRDSRGDDNEILVARLIDRPLRPMIAEGWQHETQVLCCSGKFYFQLPVVIGYGNRMFRSNTRHLMLCYAVYTVHYVPMFTTTDLSEYLHSLVFPGSRVAAVIRQEVSSGSAGHLCSLRRPRHQPRTHSSVLYIHCKI